MDAGSAQEIGQRAPSPLEAALKSNDLKEMISRKQYGRIISYIDVFLHALSEPDQDPGYESALELLCHAAFQNNMLQQADATLDILFSHLDKQARQAPAWAIEMRDALQKTPLYRLQGTMETLVSGVCMTR
ncbi:MAG: hypothetical protein KDI13_04770 [Alphaproteobacteria bacterium]|nr:hypothetical protein [Alphaproteobacteria bacterium]